MGDSRRRTPGGTFRPESGDGARPGAAIELAQFSAIELIAVDLDGTLLDRRGRASEQTRHALELAHAAGIRVLLATARPPRDVVPFWNELRVDRIALCSNGALTYDLATGTLREQRPLAGAPARALLARIRRALPDAAFALEAGLHYLEEASFRCPVARPRDPLVVPDLTAHEFASAAKLMVWSPGRAAAEVLADLGQLLGQECAATTSGADFVELAARGTSKGAALARYCGLHAIATARTLAIGDGLNDRCMLRWAGVGVAVANAHPELIAAADLVVGSNDDDGVAGLVAALAQARIDSVRASSV